MHVAGKPSALEYEAKGAFDISPNLILRGNQAE